MSKIFSTDFEHGSYIDQVSKQAGVNTNGYFRPLDKGNAYYVDSSITLQFTGLSFDLIDLITECKGEGTLRVTIGSTNNDIVLTGNAWSFEKDTFALTSQTSVTITCTSGYAWISKITGFDNSLSTLEYNNLYKDFLRDKSTGIGIYRSDYPIKPDDLSRFASDGLVASYNMIPSDGGVLVNISGNGNNGTIDAGIVSTKDGLCCCNLNREILLDESITLSRNGSFIK